MQDSVNNPVTIPFSVAAPQIAALKPKMTNKRQLKKTRMRVLSALTE
jgi:hypothetical protein